ncbi:MAG: hybrid sensor histidine kinase/response regulator transcription factor [Bacteroidota bacterium]
MKVLCYLILLQFFCISAFGSTESKWIALNLNSEDGLSNSAVTSVFQDSEGLMWFGTWDGLNRYDGTSITVFKPDILTTHSLSNNIIRDIFEDRNHDLWVITNEGINRFNRDSLTFTSYFDEEVYLPVREQNLKAVIGPDSTLIIALARFGLFYFDEETRKFASLELPGFDPDAQSSVIGTGSRENMLFTLDQKGKVTVFTKQGNYKKEAQIDLGRDTELQIDKHWFINTGTSIYLAVSVKEGGLLLTDLLTRKSSFIRPNDEMFSVTTVNGIRGSNKCWLGTDNGSLYQLVADDDPELLSMDAQIPELLSRKVKIWTISQTSEDLLWIGTDGNGIYRYILQGKAFFNLKKGPVTELSISHDIVRAIYKDKNGNLWVGTRGDGLNKIPAGNRTRIQYNVSNGLSNNAVLSLNKDLEGNLWIGVDGEGIDMLELSSGHIFHFPRDFVSFSDEDFGYVYSICVDVYGTIWLGTSGYGVVNLRVKKGADGRYKLEHFRRFTNSLDGKGLKSDIVYSIIEERPNVLWLGTRGGGLHRLNTLNNSFEYYGEASEHVEGLINNDILSLCLCDKEQLWIGTSGGITVMNISYKPYSFRHITEQNGLPNNTVHGIIQDENSDIWISTNRGLAKIPVEEGPVLSFNRSDGLRNSEYTDGAFFNDRINHLLYFGGTEGVDWFNPSEINASGHFPPVYITGFRLNNTLVIPGDSTRILRTRINETREIELKYDQNFFSFSFTSLNYYNPQKCQFAYMLEGFYDHWNEISNQRTASFTNVPPGKYTLKIKASNEDGKWSDDVRQIAIIIHQPYWNTLAAYGVYLLVLILSAFFILSQLKRRAREKREMEQEKMERAKADEINRYKLQFFTNIAHEFRTPLTLIMAPAALLEEELGEKKRYGQFAKSIFQNANRLQKLISELIEFRKVETNNMKLQVGNYELVQYINKLIKAFDVYAKLNNISLVFEPAGPEIECWIDLEKFEKILLNLISNAIKYTPEGGKVIIELEYREGKIILVVKDTGIGIPPEIIDKIFDRFYHTPSGLRPTDGSRDSGGVGLSLTKSLVEFHKGSITASSRAEGGAEFRVVIPGNRTDYISEITEETRRPSSEKIAMRVAEEFQGPKIPATPEKKATKELTSHPYTLLVVDDSIEVCNLVESLLSDQYNIIKAYDGKTALEILSEESIDLVISDVLMPGIDGLELTSIIKNDINTSHIPVILLTARTEPEHRIEGLEMGADSYIPKPFYPRHLKIRIEKLIANSERLRKAFREYNEPEPGEDLLKGLSPADRKLILGLIDFVEENMHEPDLSAEQLSDYMAMSKTQLYRKIKALTGHTPHGLIRYLRLKKAATELKKGEKTVSEVYFETGFNNRSYFYRSFKEAFGVPPGEYNREKYKALR